MDVGTLVQVLEARAISHDRWLVVVVGTRWIIVEHWLPDDPYPQAEILSSPDGVGPPVGADEWKDLKRLMRQVLAGLAGLGDRVTQATSELYDDPVIGSFQLAGLGPFPDLDRQRVLCVPSVPGHCALLKGLLDEVQALTRRRLGVGEEAARGRG